MGFYVWAYGVNVRGEHTSVRSLLLSLGPGGLNSGHQPWPQVPLPADLSHSLEESFYRWECF